MSASHKSANLHDSEDKEATEMFSEGEALGDVLMKQELDGTEEVGKIRKDKHKGIQENAEEIEALLHEVEETVAEFMERDLEERLECVLEEENEDELEIREYVQKMRKESARGPHRSLSLQLALVREKAEKIERESFRRDKLQRLLGTSQYVHDFRRRPHSGGGYGRSLGGHGGGGNAGFDSLDSAHSYGHGSVSTATMSSDDDETVLESYGYGKCSGGPVSRTNSVDSSRDSSSGNEARSPPSNEMMWHRVPPPPPRPPPPEDLFRLFADGHLQQHPPSERSRRLQQRGEFQQAPHHPKWQQPPPLPGVYWPPAAAAPLPPPSVRRHALAPASMSMNVDEEQNVLSRLPPLALMHEHEHTPSTNNCFRPMPPLVAPIGSERKLHHLQHIEQDGQQRPPPPPRYPSPPPLRRQQTIRMTYGSGGGGDSGSFCLDGGNNEFVLGPPPPPLANRIGCDVALTAHDNQHWAKHKSEAVSGRCWLQQSLHPQPPHSRDAWSRGAAAVSQRGAGQARGGDVDADVRLSPGDDSFNIGGGIDKTERNGFEGYGGRDTFDITNGISRTGSKDFNKDTDRASPFDDDAGGLAMINFAGVTENVSFNDGTAPGDTVIETISTEEILRRLHHSNSLNEQLSKRKSYNIIDDFSKTNISCKEHFSHTNADHFADVTGGFNEDVFDNLLNGRAKRGFNDNFVTNTKDFDCPDVDGGRGGGISNGFEQMNLNVTWDRRPSDSAYGDAVGSDLTWIEPGSAVNLASKDIPANGEAFRAANERFY